MTPELTLTGLGTSYLLSLVIIFVLMISKTPLMKKTLTSLIRMSLQLTAIGFALHWLFSASSPILSLTLILLMVLASAQIILSHAEIPFKPFFFTVFWISLTVNGALTAFFVFFIARPDSWSDPRYLIPLSGMLLGNSMNSGVVALRNLYQLMTRQKERVEQKLALGATPQEAVKDFTGESYRLSLLPTLSSMAGMGIVSLPGMMTGQILSGTSPLLAVRYQIAIMLAITASVALGNFLILRFACRKFFTPRLTLKEPGRNL